jgi:hypothetical protein
MNLLAIVESPRKGKATDILVDKAIEGGILRKAPSFQLIGFNRQGNRQKRPSTK